MKYLLLLLLATPVWAAESWVGKDNMLSELVLTKRQAAWCGGLYMMYAVRLTNDVEFGCWVEMDGRIHVEYTDGRRVAYPVKNFVKTTHEGLK